MSILTREISPIVDNESTHPGSVETQDDIDYAESYREPYQGNLGIDLRPDGCNFAVHTGPNVKHVDLLIHHPTDPGVVIKSLRLSGVPSESNDHHAVGGFIPGLEPDDIYSLTVHYDDNPANSNSEIHDPYAKEFVDFGKKANGQPRLMPKVSAPSREKPRPLSQKTQPENRIIYEAHIKGATMLSEDIPEELRGTYAGFAHPANIKYLKELGITTVELLPVQQNAPEEHLYSQGKDNYWGYSTIGFFAPHNKYASQTENNNPVSEFKNMVSELHEAGIEVVLDVVYNHTAEGGNGDNSPVYSFKALDNNGYYHVDKHGNYRDNTGCDNMLNMSSPVARKTIMDSLRYWADDMGIDGFRFDLAASLLRNEAGEIDPHNSPFLREATNDPTLRKKLLIAEPWDIGGYPAGEFRGMQEWNGGSRDAIRRFWNTPHSAASELAHPLAGGFDPKRVINFVTAHDGFPLYDLVSYNDKHNLGNGEDNRDGTDDNISFNHGAEGPTNNPDIIYRRTRAAKNLALTTMMAIGTPMINAGDEILRTQLGNNNAYAQDNEISWTKYDNLSSHQIKMLEFMKELIKIRGASSLGHTDIHMGKLTDSPIDERGIDWLNQHGENMSIGDWNSGTKIFGMYSSGISGGTTKDSLIYFVNGSEGDEVISLPQNLGSAGEYTVVAETNYGSANINGVGKAPDNFILPAKSSVVLKRISANLPKTIVNQETQDLRSKLLNAIPNIGTSAFNLTNFDNPHHRPLPKDFLIDTAEATLPRAA